MEASHYEAIAFRQLNGLFIYFHISIRTFNNNNEVRIIRTFIIVIKYKATNYSNLYFFTIRKVYFKFYNHIANDKITINILF